MREVFNMGIGLIFVIAEDKIDLAIKLAKEQKENPIVVGTVE
jgi:phosphoribosylaminoimidazole (AIR) synthetase